MTDTVPARSPAQVTLGWTYGSPATTRRSDPRGPGGPGHRVPCRLRAGALRLLAQSDGHGYGGYERRAEDYRAAGAAFGPWPRTPPGRSNGAAHNGCHIGRAGGGVTLVAPCLLRPSSVDWRRVWFRRGRRRCVGPRPLAGRAPALERVRRHSPVPLRWAGLHDGGRSRADGRWEAPRHPYGASPRRHGGPMTLTWVAKECSCRASGVDRGRDLAEKWDSRGSFLVEPAPARCAVPRPARTAETLVRRRHSRRD